MTLKFEFIFIIGLMFCLGCTTLPQKTSDTILIAETAKNGERMPQNLEAPIKRRKAIWEAMGETQYPEVRPLLTLEQFFLHSDGQADLWYNVAPYPEGIDQFEFHRSIRKRGDVWDVLISITQLDSKPALSLNQYDESGWFEWPNSDHTLIVTTADEDTIRSWFPPDVQPDEIYIGDGIGTNWASPKFIPKGFHQAWLWYD